MKAKIDTVLMNKWDAFEKFMEDIYGDWWFEVASDQQIKFEYEQFIFNLD